MAANGWIKLHRKIQQNYLWSEKRKFSKFEAWVDILLMVNHDDAKVPLGNELIEVKRGSRITSYWKLAERWDWSRTKVTAFLKLLQVDGMLIVNSDAKKTVLTVVNYDFYQDRETEKSHKKDTEKTQKRRNKNEKNNKEKRINTFIETDPPLILANELFNLIQNNNPTVKQPNLQSWAEDIDRMIRLDKRSETQIREVIQFSQTDQFWQTNILSANKLREKYDQLYLKSKNNQSNKPNAPPKPIAKKDKFNTLYLT